MDSKDNNTDAGALLAARRFALIIDGLSRAAVVPFAPRLIHRLLFVNTNTAAAPWSRVTFPLATMICLYLVGRHVGTILGSKLVHSRVTPYVSRLGGLTLALHIFSLGAGLESLNSFILIRFMVGGISGFLCSITRAERSVAQELSVEKGLDEEAERMPSRNSCLEDVDTGTAKVYFTAFALSILTGGLLYRPAHESKPFRTITGGEILWSLLFFTSVACVSELFLSVIFWLSSKRTPKARAFDETRRLLETPPKRRSHVHSLTLEAGYDDDALSRSNRSRLDSARSDVSMSEFFDCQSFDELDFAVDLENGGQFHDVTITETDIAEYKDNMCLYPNGSPAFVPPGTSEATVPGNVLDFCSGNHRMASRMWQATQQWRREEQIWRIHRIPHPLFARIKDAYPHIIHGHTKQGFPIVYEQPGRMDLKSLFRNGGEVSDVLHHYGFLMEYISNVLCNRDEIRRIRQETSDEDSSPWGLFVVMDIGGATLSHLSGDVLKYLKQAGDINSAHYPLSMKRACLVNSPWFLAGVFATVKGILPESVHVDILSPSSSIAALREHIEDDQIPTEYGGSSPFPLCQHPYELALSDVVEIANSSGDSDTLYTLPPPSEVRTRSVSFEHRAQIHGLDDDETVQTGSNNLGDGLAEDTWKREVSSPARAVRRRAPSSEYHKSYGRQMSSIFEENNTASPSDESYSQGGEGAILTIVSFLFWFWSSIQGAMEMAIPLWMLSPPNLGGIGYAPLTCGASIFCASVVVLWLMRTGLVRAVSVVPSKAPMRAFRVGVGSEAALLVLLPLAVNSITSVDRSNSVVVMAFTVIVLATLVFARMLGRSGSSMLHQMACDRYCRRSNKAKASCLSWVFGNERIEAGCATGRLTTLLNVSGEVVGIVVVTPYYSWATEEERPFPSDASYSLLAMSLFAFLVYLVSFAVSGDASFLGDGSTEQKARRWCSFLRDLIAVPISDIASLMEEANWSSAPLLGYSRRRLSSHSFHESHIHIKDSQNGVPS